MVCAHSPVCDDKSQYVPINLDRKDTQGYRAHRVTGRTGLQGARRAPLQIDCLPDNYNERRLNLNLAMYEITLSISEETVQALKLTPEKLDSEILLAAAVKLYELGRLSSGAAANLARIPRVVFLSKLAEFGVDTFRLTESELAEDLANA